MLRHLFRSLCGILASLGLLSLCVGIAAAGTAAPIVIDAVHVSDDHSRLKITGRNLLAGGSELTAVLRGVAMPLHVTLRTDTQVDALLPNPIAPGEHLLRLGYGTQSTQYDEFPLWIGASAIAAEDRTVWHPGGTSLGNSLRIPRMTWTDIMVESVAVTSPLADLVIHYDATFAARFPCSPYLRATVNGMPLVSTRIAAVPRDMGAGGAVVASGGQTVLASRVGPGQYTVAVQAYLDWPLHESTCTQVTALDLPVPGASTDTASVLTVRVVDR